MQSSKFLLSLATLGAILVFAHPVSADTPVGGFYSTDQHWTLTGSPYIVEEENDAFGVGILAGATLTIDPGVVVKFKPRTQFWVDGIVIAIGTETEPIIFTSFFDDSVGEDTDGLGFTSGSSGDWWRIGGNNPSLEFNYAKIRYSGLGFDLALTNSPITVTNSTIENGGYGFRLTQNSGNLTIENNIIQNNTYGFFLDQVNDSSNFAKNNIISGNSFRGAYNLTPASPTDLRNNSWGDPSGPFHLDLNPYGLGNQVSDGILFDPWSEKSSPPPGSKNPVIIIPGIYGTELWNQDELIWADLGRMFTDVNDQFLTENLGLDGEGKSVNIIEAKRMIERMAREPFAVNIFENLIKEMLLAGYETNVTLFTLPYDWRLDLETSTSLLNQKIEEVKNSTGTTQVDLIAHSMGGLLAKNYINRYGQSSIDKLIFVGTPHLGAPKAAKVILFGDSLNIPWLESDRIKELAHNSISAYELLPISKYFDQFTGYIKKYGSDQIVLGYNQTNDFLLNEKDLNSYVFTKADEFSNKHLENMDFPSIKAFNIAGCKTGTQVGYQFGKNNLSVSKTKYASGDGTVPLPSADYVGVPTENKFYVKNSNHAELPSTIGVRELILGILKDEITLANNVSRSQNFCNFKGKELLWRSPVAVHIYDGFNNHTGPVENNGIAYGVPGVDYDIIGEEKFIFLPTDDDQSYHITAEGQADSTFDLLISESTDGEVSNTSVFNDVAITPQTTVDFDITKMAIPSSIQVDLLGNGTAEIVSANAELTNGEGDDVIPPETEAIVSGATGLNGWHMGTTSVAFSATDDLSGVLVTRYYLNDSGAFLPYTTPIEIADEATTTIKFYSVDNAGNNEDIKTLEIKIDRTPPEISAQFSIDNRDFLFSALDNLDTSPTISCIDTICQAEDRAGNKTVAEFKKTGLPRKGKGLSFKNLRYNDNAVVLPDNLLAVYLTQQKNLIKLFNQTFSIKQKVVLDITYDPKKDLSIIMDWSDGTGPQIHTETGIKFLQVFTDKGMIKIDIK